MKPTAALAAIICLLALPAGADVFSMEGDRYVQTSNPDGIVLTSEFIKYRIVGQGAESHVVERKEVFYLGRSCDAYHQTYGKGTWGWNNAGVIIEFDSGQTFTFRFELDIQDDAMLDCWG